MGRQLSGAQFNVKGAGTAGTGQYIYYLIDPTGGSCAPQGWTFTENAPQDDRTAVDDTAKVMGALRKDATAELTCRYPKATRKTGYQSLITVNSGTATVSRARSFTLTIDWGEQELTPFDVSAYPTGMADWRQFGPNFFPTATLSWEGTRDDATAEAAAYTQQQTLPALTIRMSDETTDNAIAFAGAVVTSKRIAANVPQDGPQTYGFDAVCSGAITLSGTQTILPSGVLARQICTDSSGIPNQFVQFDGDAANDTNRITMYAYLQRLVIASSADGVMTVTATLRSSGPCTAESAP